MDRDDAPTVHGSATAVPGSAAPSHIGPYRIIEQIGAGGMGSVYRAEQEHPIRRQVALKLVKLGMDTAEVIARFESERQALAVMSHPNIARVLDAGATDQGRPFFVMELVEGEPITEYCDRRRLGVNPRLELVIQVCEGVHHAHQKGVIHRDLKPSNILVATVDGRPAPKIIDFGIAKAMDQRPGGGAVTELGHAVGTPEFMSPEQMGATYPDIDIRSDVYSLGVLMYLLLAGTHPFATDDSGRAGAREVWRKVCFEDPTPPSARLARREATSGEVAQVRGTDPRSLTRRLRGDLDWIAIKCLERDRANRYGTALELAADIRRHLDNLPVVAGPPEVSYRLRKFVRRHTLGVVAGATILAALVLGIAGTSHGLLRARQAERRAQAEAEAARKALAETQELSRFLVDLFEVSNPGEARGATITARELLDRGAEQVRSGLDGQPLAQARLMLTIGSIYQNLGLYSRAEALLRESLTIRERELGPDHLDVAASLNSLGVLAMKLDRYAEAEQLFRRGLEIREKQLGQDHPDVALHVNNLATLYADQDRYKEAEPLYIRALQIREKALGPDHPDVAVVLNNLGDLYREQGRYAEAESALRRALEIKQRTLGPDHPSLAISQVNLANAIREQGRFDEAEPLLRRALEINQKVLGASHPEVARNLVTLSDIISAKGGHAEAESNLRRALAIWEAALGPEHSSVGLCLARLAQECLELGRFDEAEAYQRRALTISEGALGPAHTHTGFFVQGLASLYYAQGRHDEAERLYRRALAILEPILPPDHPGLVATQTDYAHLLRDLGRSQEASELEARIAQATQRQ